MDSRPISCQTVVRIKYTIIPFVGIQREAFLISWLKVCIYPIDQYNE